MRVDVTDAARAVLVSLRGGLRLRLDRGRWKADGAAGDHPYGVVRSLLARGLLTSDNGANAMLGPLILTLEGDAVAREQPEPRRMPWAR